MVSTAESTTKCDNTEFRRVTASFFTLFTNHFLFLQPERKANNNDVHIQISNNAEVLTTSLLLD
jgi:hypothetical protein